MVWHGHYLVTEPSSPFPHPMPFPVNHAASLTACAPRIYRGRTVPTRTNRMDMGDERWEIVSAKPQPKFQTAVLQMQLWHSEWTRPKWNSHGWPFAGQVASFTHDKGPPEPSHPPPTWVQGCFSFVLLHFIDFSSFRFFLSRGKDGEDILSAAPRVL